jgi:hypothetical protein
MATRDDDGRRRRRATAAASSSTVVVAVVVIPSRAATGPEKHPLLYHPPPVYPRDVVWSKSQQLRLALSLSPIYEYICDSLSPPMQAMVGDDPALHDRWNTHSLFESVPIFMRCLYISHIFQFFCCFLSYLYRIRTDA